MKKIILILVFVGIAGTCYGYDMGWDCWRCGLPIDSDNWDGVVYTSNPPCYAHSRCPTDEPDTSTIIQLAPIDLSELEVVIDDWFCTVTVGDSSTNHFDIDPAILDQLNRIEAKLDALIGESE